jgi:hypothetical protein
VLAVSDDVDRSEASIASGLVEELPQIRPGMNLLGDELEAAEVSEELLHEGGLLPG